jgi:DNA-binding transcriptional ArsR family regulator
LDRCSGGASLRCLRASLGELSLMDMAAAIAALGALAHENRLVLFKLLVQAGPEGISAGSIAEKLGIPSSSLSFHLAQLRDAGLIGHERKHRKLIYRANYPAMNALVDYLTENCCSGAECTSVPATTNPGTITTKQRKTA